MEITQELNDGLSNFLALAGLTDRHPHFLSIIWKLIVHAGKNLKKDTTICFIRHRY